MPAHRLLAAALRAAGLAGSRPALAAPTAPMTLGICAGTACPGGWEWEVHR